MIADDGRGIMNKHDARDNAPEPLSELDEFMTLRTGAPRRDHEAQMMRRRPTTSILISREEDLRRAEEAAMRMGWVCGFSVARLAQLTDLVADLADDIFLRGGGFLRLTPIPSAVRMAVQVEAEGPQGPIRRVVDADPEADGGAGRDGDTH